MLAEVENLGEKNGPIGVDRLVKKWVLVAITGLVASRGFAAIEGLEECPTLAETVKIARG